MNDSSNKLIWLTQNEASIRLLIYFGALCIMGTWEQYSKALPTKTNKSIRWFHNIVLAWSGSLLVRALIPAAALGTAEWVSREKMGLFINTPIWLNILMSILLLDCLIYWQHRIFHRVPLLWRLHATHHSDPEVDASTAARFHPIEILLSMFIKIGAIIIFGCSPIAVLLFEIILNASATFNHGNIKLPNTIEKTLSPWLVTPSTHRIHHSANPIETHSNFGFCLIIWDKVFGSFRRKALKEDTLMILGLPNLPSTLNTHSAFSLLLFPLKYTPKTKKGPIH